MINANWQSALTLIAAISGPVFAAALAGAIIAALIKAAVQLDDSLISIAARIAAVVLVGYLGALRYSEQIVEFARRVWGSAENYF